jgi:hypothetical protein
MVTVSQIVDTVFAPDDTAPSDIPALREAWTNARLSIFEEVVGTDSGSYSNEGSIYEPDFATTFFGSSYPELINVKSKYDPDDLFIVTAGVGSERWDSYGLCRV